MIRWSGQGNSDGRVHSMTLEELLQSHRGAGHERLGPDDLNRFRSIAKLLPDPPATVLDAGCGVGVLTDWLTKAGYDATGVDVDEALMINIAAPHVAASLDALPFEDGQFEATIASEVLEHLPITIYDSACAELARVARGVIVVTVPNSESLESASTRCPRCSCVYSIYGHVRRFDPADMEGLLPGWRLDALSQVGPWKARHRTLEWHIRRRLLGRWPAQPGVTCPQCNYRQPGEVSIGRGSRIGRWARLVAGVPWRQRWHLIARYVPT
jgi:SAM-dependent methyltransferase